MERKSSFMIDCILADEKQELPQNTLSRRQTLPFINGSSHFRQPCMDKFSSSTPSFLGIQQQGIINPRLYTSPNFLSNSSYMPIQQTQTSFLPYIQSPSADLYQPYLDAACRELAARSFHWDSVFTRLPFHKRKGGQVRFSNEQTIELEKKFDNERYLSPSERKKVAKKLQLSERQVKTWFQNRRAKWRRLKQEQQDRHPNLQNRLASKSMVSNQEIQDDKSESSTEEEETIDITSDISAHVDIEVL